MNTFKYHMSEMHLTVCACQYTDRHSGPTLGLGNMATHQLAVALLIGVGDLLWENGGGLFSRGILSLQSLTIPPLASRVPVCASNKALTPPPPAASTRLLHQSFLDTVGTVMPIGKNQQMVKHFLGAFQASLISNISSVASPVFITSVICVSYMNVVCACLSA